MNTSLEQFTRELKQRGLSLTGTRRIIFNSLQGQEPLSMRELVQRCHSVDRASVYRSVALFEQLGIVQRLQIGWKYKLELTDAFSQHHHHLSCISCGKVIRLPEDLLLEQRLHYLARTQRFSARDHQLEIRGLCSDCSGES